MPEQSANSLNSNHERRLSVTCRHIDRLLAEMESVLNISASKLAFPQYALDLSPAQRRVVEDYISRIRTQLVRVLDGQMTERFDISQLQEFVAEQLNHGNEKHVTRIVVQLPSSRLREGIAFVDTPGLGSLATRGAAETLAYLPLLSDKKAPFAVISRVWKVAALSRLLLHEGAGTLLREHYEQERNTASC
jgi:hypothetical protein